MWRSARHTHGIRTMSSVISGMQQATPTPLPIRFLRCVRLLLHFMWMGFGAAVIYRFSDTSRRLQLRQRWSRQVLAILGIRLDMAATSPSRGRLIVANHISWLDIFAINALRPAAFIAKAEIRRWPFFGWLAVRNDTVFLQRGSRQHARIVNEEINALLNADLDVAVFPEGRTSDGTRVLDFHAALLQPAIESGRPILPLAISYHDESGQRSHAPTFADVSLPHCFFAILACRSLTARLSTLPEIHTAGQSRREISRAAHNAIATRLGFLPAHSQPGISPGPPA